MAGNAHLLFFLLVDFVSEQLQQLGGELAHDVPGVDDVGITRVGRAHAEPDHVAVVEGRRHHVQLSGRVDARQQLLVQLVGALRQSSIGTALLNKTNTAFDT